MLDALVAPQRPPDRRPNTFGNWMRCWTMRFPLKWNKIKMLMMMVVFMRN